MFWKRPELNKIDESTPFIAASDGDLTLLQQSLTHLSINANIADTNGLTPLHSASSYNQIEVMKWLFTQQQQQQQPHVTIINAVDNDGDTPLHHCDQLEAVMLLVSAGADYTIRNKDGDTVLETKEEELREYYSSNDCTTFGGDVDDLEDDEEVVNLNKIIKYLRGLSKKS